MREAMFTPSASKRQRNVSMDDITDVNADSYLDTSLDRHVVIALR